MKKYLVVPLALLFVAGCNDDNPVTLTEGDPNDPIITSFEQQFDSIDQLQGQMVEMMFASVEEIMNQGGGVPVMSTSAEFAVTTVWDEETKFWVTTVNACDTDACFSAEDRIQFIQGEEGAVQFPDGEKISQINSFLTLEVTGDGINEAAAHQDMVVEFERATETLVLNGTGGASISLQHTDPQTQAVCDISMAFETTAAAVRIAMNSGTDGCPSRGRLIYDGRLTIACTGDGDFTLDQRYDVSVAFEEGQVTTQVVSGGNIWTRTESCGPAL